MHHRLDAVPAIHTLHRVVAARDYNRVRLALLRLGNPTRLQLRDMRCLSMILSDQHWLCVDECAQDRPVAAWTDFQPDDRHALHTPVSCRLRLYHIHAGLVMGEVLEALGRTLQRRLRSDRPATDRL